MEPNLLGALADPEFRRDVAAGLLDAGNRGVTANVLGLPIDSATGLLNAGKMAIGYLGHKAGLLNADQMPQPVERPMLGSEWWGDQMHRAGVVSGNRNPVAELLAGLALPAAWQKAGPALHATEQAASAALARARQNMQGTSIPGAKASVAEVEPGSLAINTVANAVENSSRNAKMNTLKPLPQRDFSHDYPQGAAGQPGDRLQFTIDGDPIEPGALVVGRKVVGGMDQAATAADAASLAKALGVQSQEVSASRLAGDLGRYVATRGLDGGVAKDIFLRNNLDDNSRANVFSHELGHALDDALAGRYAAGGSKMSSQGLTDPLAELYSDLNTTLWASHWRKGATPKSQGYPPSERDAERWAEAFRAYLQNPNELKARFPEVARRIRHAVNTDPNLNGVIQFNSAAGLGLGLGSGLLDNPSPDR